MEYINAAESDFCGINRTIKEKIAAGCREITVKNARSMHNLCVGLQGEGEITIEDSTGLYTASYLEGPRVVVDGNAGWYAGDDMMSGELIVRKNAGCNLGAYICGGNIVIYGSTGSRAGYGMKGGNIIVCGSVGRWAAQMSTGGSLIVLGAIGAQTGESMYRGAVYTRDPAAKEKLGGNVFLDAVTQEETEKLSALFSQYGIEADTAEFLVIRPAVTGRHTYVLFSPKLDYAGKKMNRERGGSE